MAKKYKLPRHLILTALLSSSLTIVLSMISIVLSSLALTYRYKCEENPGLSASAVFMNTVYRVYIQSDDCEIPTVWPDLTSSNSVFVLVIITLIMSALCLTAASSLIAVINKEGKKPLHLVVYVYVGMCIASLVVDITFGIHFGIDYTTLTRQMDSENADDSSSYVLDMLRLGAFLFMTISLKGFIGHAINIVFIILLVVYVADYHHTDIHSIHRQGALYAYDQRRKNDDLWQPQPEILGVTSSNGPQINSSYLDDDLTPRHSMRERDAALSDYSNRIYDRSESWQADPLQSSRPFSYLDEKTRTVPEWTAPPLPAPDYSPQPQRGLKSALKPAYKI